MSIYYEVKRLFIFVKKYSNRRTRLDITIETLYMIQKYKKLMISVLFAVLLLAVTVFCIGCNKPEEPLGETVTLEYAAAEHGKIVGETSQTIRKGEDGAPVTAVADDGWIFVTWDDGITTATRQEKNLEYNLIFTARFDKAYNVIYKATDAGYIEGDAEQYVLWTAPSTEVTAVPNEGYEFYCWSDGVKTATRSDIPFKSDFEVTALFKMKEYKVRYILQEGGYFVEGEEEHSIPHGSYTPPIVVAPLPYYKFLGWSDGVTTLYRQEKITADFEVTALFEPLEVPVNYGVYKGGRIEGSTSQSIVCGNDATAVTAIPNEGYEFLGWTDGVKTATRQDTNVKHNIHVKANFAPIGSTQYKVLMVYVTKLQAKDLRSNIGMKDPTEFRYVDVDYTMSEAEWQIYDRITINVGECINDMFDGKVWFVFESYFTNDTVYQDSLQEGWENRYLSYGIEPSWIGELEEDEILNDYDSVMTTFCMNDYDIVPQLHNVAGSAGKKYGYVHTETLLDGFISAGVDPSVVLDERKYKEWWDSYNSLYLHEFTHTCEIWGSLSEQGSDLHGTIAYYSHTQGVDFPEIEMIRLFLLREARVEGVEVGILPDYWSYNAKRREYTIHRVPSIS